MGAQFGSYSPVVQLGVTWTETITLTDEAGDAIDLTGKSVRAQLRPVYPLRDGDTAEPEPVLEVTTAGYYDTAPAWPVVEGFAISDPTDGTIAMTVDVDDVWRLSPDNAKRAYRWSLVLEDAGGTVVPVVAGKVSVLPAVTL